MIKKLNPKEGRKSEQRTERQKEAELKSNTFNKTEMKPCQAT